MYVEIMIINYEHMIKYHVIWININDGISIK